jgi:hypothetical protein
MSSTLRIADLHEAYRGVSQEEAIAMANLGAVCYKAVKADLYEQWSSSMEGDESAKAEVWRQEGRQMMLESVRAKLVAAEEAVARAAAAEGQVQQLRTSVEADVKRRLTEALEGHRKDYEIAKMAEISALKERIAMSEGKDEFSQLLKESHITMNATIVKQNEQLAAYKEQLQAAKEADTKANTRSSHAIGKQGEATVLELLQGPVMATFPYSHVKDMTSVHHAADFHVWIMNESGTRKKILVDSKNYSQPVNSMEVTKLNKDVDADDEAHGGILISLSTPIAAKKQFQIIYSPKQKPILFLTFMDMDSDLKKDILCWAIHAMMAIIGESDHAARNQLLENIDQFMEDVNASVKDLDKVITSQIKTLEATRQIRSGIIHKLTAFREGKSDTAEITITHVEDEVLSDSGCITVLKSTGLRCGKTVLNGRAKCRHHTSSHDKRELLAAPVRLA